MKILLLAPQPFFQERGTPIAVDLLLRALSARGESVDVLTYHEGSDVAYPGVVIHRIPKIPFIHNISPGPSFKKFVCDCLLFWSALRMSLRQRYDLVHAVEESVFAAFIIRLLRGIPYLYDMDSSLAGQIMDKYPPLRLLAWPLRFFEALAIRHAEVVVPVCDALAENVRRFHPKRVTVLHDISLLNIDGYSAATEPSLRRELNISGPLVMYVGNLERYQGIDLLLRSFALAHKQVPQSQLVIVGGRDEHIQHYREQARSLGTNGSVHFLGPRPVASLAGLLQQADILVSPRIQGGNTPMKVYSYLDSGTAVLATRLPTHTQVMDSSVAELADPTPEAFGQGLLRLLTDAKRRATLGQAARALILKCYSYPAFERTLQQLYKELEVPSVGQER